MLGGHTILADVKLLIHQNARALLLRAALRTFGAPGRWEAGCEPATALADNCTLGCIQICVARKWERWLSPPTLLYWGPICSTVSSEAQHKKDVEQVQETMKITRGLEKLSYEERLRGLGFFTLEREGTKDTSMQPSNASREVISRRERLFTWSDTDRTRGISFKLEEGRCGLDVIHKFFTQRAVRHKLPWEVVDVPFLLMFMASLYGAQSSLT